MRRPLMSKISFKRISTFGAFAFSISCLVACNGIPNKTDNPYYISPLKNYEITDDRFDILGDENIETIQEFIPVAINWYNSIDINEEQNMDNFIDEKISEMGPELIQDNEIIQEFNESGATKRVDEFELLWPASQIYSDIVYILMTSENHTGISPQTDTMITIKEEDWTNLGDAINYAIDIYYNNGEVEKVNRNRSDTETEEISEDESVEQTQFEVNSIIYEDEYVEVNLKDIDTESINFEITSKLENRDIKFGISALALDGVVIPGYSNAADAIIKPNSTANFVYNVELTSVNHQHLSMCGNLFDDNGRGFAYINVCDYELGGSAFKEYEIENSISIYDSDSISVGYVLSSDNKLEFCVTNKESESKNISAESLNINGTEISPYNAISIPGNSLAIYEIYIDDPDFVSSDIYSMKGSMHLWGDEDWEYTEDFNFELSF